MNEYVLWGYVSRDTSSAPSSARWYEKCLSKCNLIKHTSLWCNRVIKSQYFFFLWSKCCHNVYISSFASILFYLISNKCLNVRERVEVLEWNKRWPPPFPWCPVNRQWLWKKTLIGPPKWGTKHLYNSIGFSFMLEQCNFCYLEAKFINVSKMW